MAKVLIEMDRGNGWETRVEAEMPGAPDMTDAEAMARFALLDIIAMTACETGMRAGPGAEKLADALLSAIRDPATAWAFRALLPPSP